VGHAIADRVGNIVSDDGIKPALCQKTGEEMVLRLVEQPT
jgi:hypothetical protein